MKRLFTIGFLTLLFPVAYAQNSIASGQTFNPSEILIKEVRPRYNYVYRPFTQPELFSKQPDAEAGYTLKRGIDETANLLLMPSSYQQGEMMNIVGMFSTIGKWKFYCNYYFDNNGLLLDSDITISKLK